jgi:hypothetical protein
MARSLEPPQMTRIFDAQLRSPHARRSVRTRVYKLIVIKFALLAEVPGKLVVNFSFSISI